jgi:hypothetical protein
VNERRNPTLCADNRVGPAFQNCAKHVARKSNKIVRLLQGQPSEFLQWFYIFKTTAEPSSGTFMERGPQLSLGGGKMTRHIRKFIAMALATAAFALTTSAAMAQSYTGNWPATVTQSQRDNGTYCISLTDDLWLHAQRRSRGERPAEPVWRIFHSGRWAYDCNFHLCVG